MKKQSTTRFKIILDKRKQMTNGQYKIKVRLFHQGKDTTFNTGLSCTKEHWIYGDIKNTEYKKAISKGEIRYVSTKNSASKRLNNQIEHKASLINVLLDELPQEIQTKSITELKELILHRFENPVIEVKKLDKQDSTLTVAFQKKIDECDKGEDWGNKRVYTESLNCFKGYLKNEGIPGIRLSLIDRNFLNNFVQYCKSSKCGRIKKGTQEREGMKPNSISIKLRGLRHIINRAIDDKNEVITLADYPFRGFTLPKNSTIKRAIKIDSIDKIRALKLKRFSPEWHHRNYFLFMFNNQGMNLVDLAFFKRHQVRGNRLTYERAKTRGKAVFDIELTEESLEILHMYEYEQMKTDEILFPFMKDLYGTHSSEYVFKTYKNRTGDHNKYLKRLAEMAELDTPLTSYVARHTWASVGFQKFESIDVVGQGLGHASDPKVTKVYAKDLKKDRMDEVNKSITERSGSIQSLD